MIRYRIYFSGHVQGVGFRYTARQVARAFNVAGYVENLADGRVLLVAEGEPEELDRFVEELSAQMGQFIRAKTISREAATGEFGRPGLDAFTIRH